MELRRILGHRDAISLLEVISCAVSCETENDLVGCAEHLKKILPFESAACSLASISPQKTITPISIVNINYPDEWIGLYVQNQYHEQDPIYLENFKYFQLQEWRQTYRRHKAPKEFLSTAEDFGLRNGYTTGNRNSSGDVGSLLSLSGACIEYGERSETILDVVLPHFHQALLKIAERQGHRRSSPKILTPKQLEVLRWVGRGKSNWDISRILNLSANTIKFHLTEIFRRLDAVSRTQAVAIALERKMIELD
jgi:DNA-binding CsgD family transcriptional regulator